MKKVNLLLLGFLFGFLFITTSCDKDDDDDIVVVESELLIEHIEGAGNPVNTFPIMIKSSDVNDNILADVDQYVIDTRAEADYNEGHIEGAVNVAGPDVVAHYEANNLQDKETVVIVCYTGQGAGWVNGLLRTKGYTNTFDMKWGMCSWNSSTATSQKWTNTVAAGNAFATQMTTDVNEMAAAGAYPTLSTGKTEATEILNARVEAVVSEGWSVSASDVYSNPENYYIVNYWSEADYSWNHVPGAIQYTPKASLTSDTFLNTLPTDKTIAVYCYTGQTSAHVTAYLRVLGYDAKSVLFGVNGMSYDAMPGTKFMPDTDVHEYPLVTE